MDEKKNIDLVADLCYQWGFGQYLSSFQKLTAELEKKGYTVKYTANKESGGKQEVYLVKGGDKTLVYSKVQTGKFIDDVIAKEVAEKIIGMLWSLRSYK